MQVGLTVDMDMTQLFVYLQVQQDFNRNGS